VQNRIKGAAHEQGLLPWLNDCVWPEESRFADSAYAKASATEFFADAARHGTLVGAVYSSITKRRSKHSPRVRPFIVGNVLMTEKLARRADTICQRGVPSPNDGL